MSISKILIVDDEPYIARVLKLTLQQEGYQVTCVNNGKQALEAYAAERPDLIITDVKMPQMTGNELVDAVRNSHGDTETQIIVMTSTLESENRSWVADVVNLTFLGKPVSPRDLTSIVNSFTEQSKAS